MGQAGEPALIQAFVAQAAIGGLDEGILHRLAGLMECQPIARSAAPACPVSSLPLSERIESRLRERAPL